MTAIHILAACAMSGLIADARTLIDRARVEAQVTFPFPFFNRNMTSQFFVSLEPLVYVWREDECWVGDAIGQQPCPRIRWRRPRRVSYGERISYTRRCNLPTRTCSISDFHTEPTFWSCPPVRRTRRKRTSAVSSRPFWNIPSARRKGDRFGQWRRSASVTGSLSQSKPSTSHFHARVCNIVVL